MRSIDEVAYVGRRQSIYTLTVVRMSARRLAPVQVVFSLLLQPRMHADCEYRIDTHQQCEQRRGVANQDFELISLDTALKA